MSVFERRLGELPPRLLSSVALSRKKDSNGEASMKQVVPAPPGVGVMESFCKVLETGDGPAAAKALLTIADASRSYQRHWARWQSATAALDLISVSTAIGPDAEWQGHFYGIRVIFGTPTMVEIILPSFFATYETARAVLGAGFGLGERVRQILFNVCELLLQDTVALSLAVKRKIGKLPKNIYFRVSERDGCWERDVITISRTLGSNNIPIPDGYYYEADSYKSHKARVAADPLPWADRNNTALWRGVTTGTVFDSTSMEKNERINLAYHCAERPDLFDVKLIRVVQVQEPDRDKVHKILEERGLLGPTIAMDVFRSYKFALHIDGNSSAAGFFGENGARLLRSACC